MKRADHSNLMDRIEIAYEPALQQDVVFRNAWIPNFQARPIGKRLFCASPAGHWGMLDPAEYEATQSVSLTRDLFERLERSFLILTRANSASYFESYEAWSAAHFRHPSLHIVVATLRCNLACSYCHAAVVPPDAGQSFDLSEEIADAIIEFAMNSRSNQVAFEFQGGESLLNGNILRYMIPRIRSTSAVEGKRVELSLQTNGTLLNERWMEFFTSHDVRLGTSIDGPSQLHDRQRPTHKGRGSHAAVIRTVKKFGIGALPTVTRHSLPFWQTIVDEQLARGCRTFTFQDVYPINSAAKNWSDVGIEVDEFLESYCRVVDYAKGLWRDDYYPLDRRFRLALQKLATGQDVRYPDFGNPCGMVHGQILYDTNGDIFTCDEGRDFPEFKLGNVRSSSYDEIVCGSRLRTLKSLSIPNDLECRTCALRAVCSTCPVYERAVTGVLSARHAGTAKCKHTKFIFDKLIGWLDDDPKLFQSLVSWHGLV